MTFNEVWERYQSAKRALNEATPNEGPIVETDEQKEVRAELRRQYDKLTQFVLGHPDSFDNVRCWMIDAKGLQSECEITPELVGEMTDDAEQELGHKYMEKFGALTSEVRAVMSQWNLTDSGGGCGCWHLGCHSTEQEARELCTALHSRFRHAIDRGVLAVERKPWSLGLKDEA